MEKYIDFIVNEIVTLARIPSPTGYTHLAMKYIEEEFQKLGIDYVVTRKGAVIATVKGRNNNQSRVVSAHLDTLGAMVKEIKASGRIKFTPIGGFMMNAIENENCFIETNDGNSISGTILTTKPSVHIHSDAKTLERNVDNMEIVLDERVESKEDTQKLGIEIGDFIHFDTRTQVTKTGFIKSRHMDDKASVGILLGVIKYMKENNIVPEYRTDFFFTAYEEVGHGAAASVSADAFEFLSVDMGAPGEGQNSTEFAVCICAKDSSGPYDYTFRNKLTSLSKENNIDYRIDIYPNYGSDASAALRAGYDLRTGLIGPGVFASHGYERTHKDGLLNTAKLINLYLQTK